MSRNLSAVKKKQISLRNNLLNKIYRSSIRTLVKRCLTAIKDDNKQSAHYLSAVYSKIDKAIKKEFYIEMKVRVKNQLLTEF